MVADVPSAGSTDWQTDQLFRLGGLESESAKQWFNDLRSDAHRVVDSRPQIGRRTRVAVLDSGIDWSHPCFQDAIAESRIVAKSFLQQGIPGDVDSNGHGTHTAHLVLKTTPHSKLFIARVYEHGTEEEFDNNISSVVQAIKWATEQNVDIITMSLGYRCENASIKAALRDAFHKGIILFAAASNSGVNPRFPISFPANIRQVICIHSSDGDGNPSLRNPPSTHDCNLAILGEGVAAAWPQDLFTEREDKLRVASGSSVATPIAAGLAALIIEYASQGGSALEIVTKWKRLKHCDEIRKLFQSMTRERAGYLSIAPSSLFDYHGEDMHQRVCGRIADILDSL
ncbi:subtilisin-like protein [Polyplosphaeria fusca]|uniref:Subtilisin-like protein n=1 Tax=Polyplosphaeria fusca TaxID=682080 RepID=A0A9P4QUV4_9PLEO|nr:subtilisin-like protein [Polyplosphaeria fusca]